MSLYNVLVHLFSFMVISHLWLKIANLRSDFNKMNEIVENIAKNPLRARRILKNLKSDKK